MSGDFHGAWTMQLTSSKVAEFAGSYARAWSSKSPEAVASFYADDGKISVNRVNSLNGRKAIAEMAAEFYAAFPDLVVHCDGVRTAGDHAIFLWTLEGHHVQTRAYVQVAGWEEWEINEQMKIKSSLGWFDVEEYEQQIRGGA